MKPKFANNWYGEVPAQQLRQEIQAIYQEVEAALAEAQAAQDSVNSIPPVDLSGYLPLTGGTITGPLGVTASISATPPVGVDSRAILFNHAYRLNVDNTGVGSAGTRLWLDAPDGGEVVLGPRTGAYSLDRLRLRSRNTVVEGAVGINTVTPQRRLEVVFDTTDATDGVVMRSTDRALHIWAGTGGVVLDAKTSDLSGAGNLHVRTGGTDRLVITGAGEIRLSRQAAATNEAVRADRTLSAGNGLTGGGDLTADRSLALGTPSTLTSSTTNSVTSTSHTHAITFPSTRGFGVGAYALCQLQSGTVASNDTIAGSNLRYATFVAGGTVVLDSTAPTGTWRNLGGQHATTGYLSLFVRTA